MKIVRTRAELRAALAAARASGSGPVGLVPTMGYLHEGHVSLLRAAREQCGVVVMSLFVNPTQFRPGEDLAAYPRDEQGDAERAEATGVDLLFAPEIGEIYPGGFGTSVVVEGLSEVLCGDPLRRGLEHFRGVTTVVAKLFNIVEPDLAFFGQKDAQQAVVIKRMVRDLDFPLTVEVLPTVREPDGLAMSSRNAYLSPTERRLAPQIHRALVAAAELAAGGERSAAAAVAAARAVLSKAGIEPEYLETRDAESLEPVESFNGRPVLVAVAAPLGAARLIDNIVIEPEPARAPAAGELADANSPARA